MSKRVVTDVVGFEEFFGIDHNVLEASEWVCSHEDERIAGMVNHILVIMQLFYQEHEYDTPQQWANLEHEIRELNHELYTELQKIFMDYTDELEDEQNQLWAIPYGYVQVDLSFDDVLSAGVDGITNRLFDDIREKALFTTTLLFTTAGAFQVYSNFRRAIKELTNLVDFNAQHGQKAIERIYLEFVYGEDALFNWVTSGRNTCEWCYYIESLNPQPLSAMPVDHINGGCSIVPNNPKDYTYEYKLIRGFL